MNKRIIALVGVINLLACTALAAPGLCQGAGQQPSATSKPAAARQVTLTGKVGFDQRLGQYIFYPQKRPSETLFIMNKNVADLKALAESQQIVTVEGSLPRGRDVLLIDKIDGKEFGKGK